MKTIDLIRQIDETCQNAGLKVVGIEYSMRVEKDEIILSATVFYKSLPATANNFTVYQYETGSLDAFLANVNHYAAKAVYEIEMKPRIKADELEV